jgi:hypothetical protein
LRDIKVCFGDLVAIGAEELRGQLICNNEKDIRFGHDEISASVSDPGLSADIVFHHGKALPLFTDMFRLCPNCN